MEYPVYTSLQSILRNHWNANPTLQQNVYSSRPNVPATLFNEVGIGYCPDDTVGIVDELRKLYSLEELVDYSLIKIDDKPTIEYIPLSQRKYELTLKNRWTLPIYNHRGEIISFVGRAIGDTVPKWRNLANGKSFIRGEHLYLESHFKHLPMQHNSVLIVEGYCDVLSCLNYGCDFVASIFGIQITDAQLDWLFNRKVNTYYLLFDGDLAGTIGAINTLIKIKSRDINAHVIIIDAQGMDPDEMGKELFWDLFYKGRLVDEYDYHPLQFIADTLASIDIHDPKHANILSGGGWSAIILMANFFASAWTSDIKRQIKEQFGVSVSFKRQYDLNTFYRR